MTQDFSTRIHSKWNNRLQRAARRSSFKNKKPVYNYDLQCWTVGGIVSECGHTVIHNTCYACAHAGETTENAELK